MPLNFLRKKKSTRIRPPSGAAATDGTPAPPTPVSARSGVAFDGLTEEWRLVGRMNIDGRLSDSLNKREAIEIHDVQWAPIDGSGAVRRRRPA